MSKDGFVSGSDLLECWTNLEPTHLHVLWHKGCPVRMLLLPDGGFRDLTLHSKAQPEVQADAEAEFANAWEFSLAEGEGRLHKFSYNMLIAEHLLNEMGLHVKWERREEWDAYRGGVEEKSEEVQTTPGVPFSSSSQELRGGTSDELMETVGTGDASGNKPTARKRRRAEVTQSEASKLCGVGMRLVQHWDKGERRPEGYPGRGNMMVFTAWANEYQGRKRLKKVALSMNRATAMDPHKLDSVRRADTEDD